MKGTQESDRKQFYGRISVSLPFLLLSLAFCMATTLSFALITNVAFLVRPPLKQVLSQLLILTCLVLFSPQLHSEMTLAFTVSLLAICLTHCKFYEDRHLPVWSAVASTTPRRSSACSRHTLIIWLKSHYNQIFYGFL